MLRPHVDIELAGSPQVRHTSVRQYRRYLAPYLADVAPGVHVQTVALIREPVSWLYSWYRFRARSELRSQKHVNSTAHVTFDKFIDAYLADPQPEFARVGSQADFLAGEDAVGTGVDQLFAFEDLALLVDWLSDRIGVPLWLRAINVSPGRVYKSNLLERLGALERRVRSRLVRPTSVSGRAKAESRPVLPPSLEAKLRKLLERDFELHTTASERRAKTLG